MSKFFLLVIAFFSGFSIMAMEITASRLLAPYFGNSIFVWTNIIGVVMVALAIGYYLGGRIADVKADLDVLLVIILLSGVFFVFVPWVIKPIANLNIELLITHNSSILIFFSSLLSTALIFSIPIAMLGSVSPFIIKLYSAQVNNNEIGKAVGLVFAVSTFGSIAGTFLPTLLLVPWIGTRATIHVFACLLIVLALIGLKNEKLNNSALILLPLVLFFSVNSSVKANDDVVYEDETAYQYIQVEDRGSKRYLIFNEGSAFQSLIDKNNILTDEYYDFYNLLPYVRDYNRIKNVLVIGLAGGTIASQFNYFFPETLLIDGVEIDEDVIWVAQNYFNLDSLKVNIINQDGRIYLRNNKQKYDIIIVDAYQKAMYIPWSLSSREFWHLTSERLTQDGTIAFNINSSNDESKLLKLMSNTIASVFEYVYMIRTDESRWNYMIIASNNEIDFSDLRNAALDDDLQGLTSDFLKNIKRVYFDTNRKIFTDDWAPVEFMTDKMVYDFFKT